MSCQASQCNCGSSCQCQSKSSKKLCPISFGVALLIVSAVMYFLLTRFGAENAMNYLNAHDYLIPIYFGLKMGIAGIVFAFLYDFFVCCCKARCCRKANCACTRQSGELPK